MISLPGWSDSRESEFGDSGPAATGLLACFSHCSGTTDSSTALSLLAAGFNDDGGSGWNGPAPAADDGGTLCPGGRPTKTTAINSFYNGAKSYHKVLYGMGWSEKFTNIAQTIKQLTQVEIAPDWLNNRHAIQRSASDL